MQPEALVAIEAHARACHTCEQLLARTVAARTCAPGSPSSVTNDTLARGMLVGRYAVLGLLGRGGMGEVYAAYDPQLDRRVALKLLRHQGGAGEQRAEARLLREARAIARLSHGNVITVYDAGKFGGRVFVAMEHVEGETLSAWLAAKRRSPTKILAMFVQAANGLAAAHSAGLVHRDFKPQNVMVATDGTARVADFGLVRRVEDLEDHGDLDPIGLAAAPQVDVSLTEPGELVGTPLYMSPEQFRRLPTDARTDQFSFCVALYCALYGEHPFAGPRGIAQLMAAVLAGHVRPTPNRSGVPPRLRRVIVRGLAVTPEARWPSMAALVTAMTGPRRRAVAG